MSKPSIIIPLPNHDFDPTEVAVPWQILTQQGFNVEFATVEGDKPCADPLMISGEELDPWGCIPVLKKIRVIGLTLRADTPARKAYAALEQDHNFTHPKTFADLKVSDYAGLLLPGGHAPRMVPYLENKQLQQFVAEFFETLDDKGQHKPIAAVCHGVLLAARSISPTTNKSVLYGKKTTALTWKLESTAWFLSKFLARFWDPHYYRTYREEKGEKLGHWSVEKEVTRALESEADFIDVPKGTANFLTKTSGLARDRLHNDKPAWVVQDGNYLSARWPGDAHTLGLKFVQLLKN